MAEPAIDSRNTGTTSAGASSLSWSHTVGSGLADGILVVTSDHAQSPVPSVSGIDWDFGGAPQAMSFAGSASETQGFGKAEIWSLLEPLPGTKTVKVTYSASCECGTGSSSWGNVDQITPFNLASPQTNTGTGVAQQPSVNVTSGSDEQVIDAVIVVLGPTGYNLTVGGGQTEISNHNRGASTSTGASSDEAGASSVTMSWSGALAGDTWASIAISLRPDTPGLVRGRKLATQQRMVA